MGGFYVPRQPSSNRYMALARAVNHLEAKPYRKHKCYRFGGFKIIPVWAHQSSTIRKELCHKQ